MGRLFGCLVIESILERLLILLLSKVCVAPDYLICNERVRDDVLRLAKETYKEFFGADGQASPDLGRMINERNYDRVKAMLDKTKGRVVFGGEKLDRYIFLIDTEC